jgi:hypothetical protein
VPITHCIVPAPQDRDRAIIAIAYGGPALWDILPTVRYGDSICAEITHTGYLTYVLPRTGQEPDRSFNLFFTTTPFFEPKGLIPGCIQRANIQFTLRNEGFETVEQVVVQARTIRIRTGEVVSTFERGVTNLIPGATDIYGIQWQAPERLPNESYRVELIVDPGNRQPERNENDNVASFTFILGFSGSCK